MCKTSLCILVRPLLELRTQASLVPALPDTLQDRQSCWTCTWIRMAMSDSPWFFCVGSGLQGDAPDVGMLGWQHQEGQRRRQDRIVGHAKARLGWSMGLAASRTPPSASMLHNVRVSVCMGSCCTCNAVLTASNWPRNTFTLMKETLQIGNIRVNCDLHARKEIVSLFAKCYISHADCTKNDGHSATQS